MLIEYLLIIQNRIIVIDELDAFIGKTKDAMNIILDIPLYAPKTTLIGIANSLGFFAKISQYYSKFIGHKNEELIFETYSVSQIEHIIKEKLLSNFDKNEEALFKIIQKDAIRHIGGKVASISGDIRSAFDIIKTALQNHVAKNIDSPIKLQEIMEIINVKYKTKFATIIQGLPREHQMIAAALFLKFKNEGKEIYKYDEIYSKLVGVTSKLGLPREEFNEFCENVKMLEFYGLLKAMENPKNVHQAKVFFRKL